MRTNSHGKDRHVSTYELFRGPPCSGKLDEILAEQAVYLKRKTKTNKQKTTPNIIFREIKIGFHEGLSGVDPGVRDGCRGNEDKKGPMTWEHSDC